MSNVVYDLTEAFLASTGRFPYYGIVRVVSQIGRELYRIDPDLRFAIFSRAHDRFFEVYPTLDECSDHVDFNVPTHVTQVPHLRDIFYSKNLPRDTIVPPFQAVIRRINRSRWRRAQVALGEMDMQGKTLVSTGRPKHIASALNALDKAGVSCDLIPLLHDVFPLHGMHRVKRRSFPKNFIGDNTSVINRASRIIVNSEFTKSDIERFSRDGVLPPTPEVVVVPLAHECRDGEAGITPSMEAQDRPYLLTVGATIGRKNLEVVFDALVLLKQKNKRAPRLILAGAPRRHVRNYLQKERYNILRPLVEEVPNPNQHQLTHLYRSAMALVLPSRIEGWGLPAGESLWNGTPAICSTAPVLREVCGDLGLYFDPDKPEDLAAIIERLDLDRKFLATHRARIAQARGDLRTWNDVAHEIKSIYLSNSTS